MPIVEPPPKWSQRADIMSQVLVERERQMDRYPSDDENGPHDWIAKIAKHAGLGSMKADDTPGMALDRFRKQMICVAALSVAAIEWTDGELRRLTQLESRK